MDCGGLRASLLVAVLGLGLDVDRVADREHRQIPAHTRMFHTGTVHTHTHTRPHTHLHTHLHTHRHGHSAHAYTHKLTMWHTVSAARQLPRRLRFFVPTALTGIKRAGTVSHAA